MLNLAESQGVAELMRETAATELMPRFRTLAKEDIRLKRMGDVVTVADVASELCLAAGLANILPGVPVVGEEAVEKDPGLVDLIGRPGESCWIVDPLDGTANFATDKDRFAMIVCLVCDTVAVGGWILNVPHGQMAIALKAGTLKRLGGSASDDWNNRVANDTIQTLWVKNSDDETRHRLIMAAVDGLIGINPRDELEGMMAAQLIRCSTCRWRPSCCVRAASLSWTIRSRPGPFKASRTFLDLNPAWREIGRAIGSHDGSRPFDPARSSIPGTSFILLESPAWLPIGEDLRTWGQISTKSSHFDGFTLELPPQTTAGTLHYQVILRAFF